jgi:hypothetical protein
MEGRMGILYKLLQGGHDCLLLLGQDNTNAWRQGANMTRIRAGRSNEDEWVDGWMDGWIE